MKTSLLLGQRTHHDLTQLLRDKHRLVISGASNETAKALLVAHMLAASPRRALLITDDAAHVEGLLHWLQFFEQAAAPLSFPEDQDAITVEHLSSFLRFFLSEDTAVASRELWERDLPVFADMAERAIGFKEGKSVDFTILFQDLIDRGYAHSEDRYMQPGEYRRIGDTLEIYPVGEFSPYRILFEFDVIQSIRKMSQDDDGVDEKESINELIVYPMAWETMMPLKDQLPEDTLVILDGQEDLSIEDVEEDVLTFTAFPQSEENYAHLRYLSVLKFYTLTDFLNDIRDKLQQEWSLLIVTKRAEELKNIFSEERVPFEDAKSQRKGAITVVDAPEDALLPHSIQNPDLKCAMLTDREIFTLRREAKQRSVQRLALEFITSLQANDFVVHMEHGIGRFEGMTQKFVDDLPREYLEISYAEGDKLFVPVDQADKLSKFVHEEGQEPKLTRLGSVEWKRITQKVTEEAQKTAKELLNLYARRAQSKGFAFPEDNKTQQKFEEAFSYQETPGQLKAIEDLKHDMESPHPMDRLICGDVGFGKTEVAMRAAFKAVQAGKQVAFLSPITILADQHYGSLIKRMSEFGVRIDMLSRFRTKEQQRAILEKLRKGDLDIVVGTHRLIQDDVKFFNLGLVIIDEEQRFGVKQKEKLKDMRASVDVLTLTATPIPRTLNLGLHKLRDITTITTPPPGRLPIITEVRKYSDGLIRHAIEFELNRQGQVYVLHNRVETIDAFAHKLKALLPSATFVVAHGQLKPEDLEARIKAFKEGKYDVLVSSTIIENGIDLPRANTLIVNEAERFGLSQLYQLRGRVGRSKIQAYAYLLYHSQRLKDDAKKRLQAIVEASELGSGFQISMRDLEIRGAGEILGAEQSGVMQTVGVGHYLKLLKQAVAALEAGGQSEIDQDFTVEILLPVEALLPTFYIPNEEEKISVYQKLASSEDEKMLQEFAADLREEYGEPPKQVQNLFKILRLKLTCRQSGVMRVKREETGKRGEIVLTLMPRVSAKEIMQLIKVNPQWRISGSNLRIHQDTFEMGSKDWLEQLIKDIAALQPKK